MIDIKVSDELKESMKKLKIAAEKCVTSLGSLFKELNKLQEIQESEIEKSIKIVNLERRKKHCKNYLELKKIDRELNSLKCGRRKKVQK